MGHKTIRGARLLGQIAESRVQLTILYSVVGVLWVVVEVDEPESRVRVLAAYGPIHPPNPPFTSVGTKANIYCPTNLKVSKYIWPPTRVGLIDSELMQNPFKRSVAHSSL